MTIKTIESNPSSIDRSTVMPQVIIFSCSMPHPNLDQNPIPEIWAEFYSGRLANIPLSAPLLAFASGTFESDQTKYTTPPGRFW